MPESADITILRGLRHPNGRPNHVLRLYYYQGNFFMPLVLYGGDVGLVRGAIRKFLKEHRAIVDADRAAPGYRTLVQLMDAQMSAVLPLQS